MLQRKRLSLRNRNWKRNLEKFVDEVLKIFYDVTIVLFGSRARGDYSALSDTDLLVILQNYDLDTLKKIYSIAYCVDLIAPEIHIFAKDFVLENFENNTVLLDAIYEGIVLVDNLNIVKSLKAKLNKMIAEGWFKTEKGWFKKEKTLNQ